MLVVFYKATESAVSRLATSLAEALLPLELPLKDFQPFFTMPFNLEPALLGLRSCDLLRERWVEGECSFCPRSNSVSIDVLVAVILDVKKEKLCSLSSAASGFRIPIPGLWSLVLHLQQWIGADVR